jgi:hypothetical protein
MMFMTEPWQPLVEPETQERVMQSQAADLKFRHYLVLIAVGLIPLSVVSLVFAKSWSVPVAGVGLSLILIGFAIIARRIQKPKS